MKKIYRSVRRIIFCFYSVLCFAECTRSASMDMDSEHSVESEPHSEYPVRLFPSDTTPRMLDYTPNSLVMGQVGSGKTSLLNKLSGSDHTTFAEDGGSATRVIIREPVQYGDHRGFMLVDSPGLDSDQETYKHAFLLKTALESMPYNAIFLTVKIDARTQTVKDNLLATTRFVKQYGSNLVLMCSCLDHLNSTIFSAKKRDTVCNNIYNMARKNGIRYTIIYSIKSNSTDIANAMYACMSNMNRVNITVSDEDFFTKFRIWSASEDTQRVYLEFQEEADKLLSEYIQTAQCIGAAEERHVDSNNIIAALGNYLRVELEERINTFLTNNGLVGTDFVTSTAFLEMKKKQIQISDAFLDHTKSLMAWDMLDTSDLRNLIKRCPYCGVFCIKTEGCDGETVCGNVPKQRDIISKEGWIPWYKHVVKRVNGKLTLSTDVCRKSRQPRASSQRRKDCFTIGDLKPTAELGLAGCGRSFVWGDQYFLSGPDLDAVKNMLNDTVGEAVENAQTVTHGEVKPKTNLEMLGVSNERFKENRLAYEKEIDTTIKSHMEA